MIHCLHGFLGSPHDWDEMEATLKSDLPSLSVHGSAIKADLFGADAFPEAASIPEWADAYCRREMQVRSSSPRKQLPCLLGYSLGGRLALHMTVQFPQLWSGIIIVGANPGIDGGAAREKRRRHDEIWARRFETEPWDDLMAAWDAQPVFAGKRPETGARREQDFSRARLADALRRWSPGAQTPLWHALRKTTCPMLWIAGEDDMAQAAICRRMRESVPHLETWIAPDAGHRVPWEQPLAFTTRIEEFLISTQQIGGKE